MYFIKSSVCPPNTSVLYTATCMSPDLNHNSPEFTSAEAKRSRFHMQKHHAKDDEERIFY